MAPAETAAANERIDRLRSVVVTIECYGALTS
jgi:hypothetical protein